MRHPVALAEGVEPAPSLDLEPNLTCHAALLSTETGIVDSHALMLALQGDIEGAGGFRVTLGRPGEALRPEARGVDHGIDGDLLGVAEARAPA
jgi:L-2-hydroxyglutarate oxidase LhgO